jgi:site-specific recombinase XerD
MTEPLTPIVANNQLDLSLKAWLHEKFGRTASEQTRKAYTGTITAFRDLLRAHGRDLAWVPGPGQTDKHVCQELALYAQAFAGARVATSHHKGEISPATKNQRLSILSSFYKFANQHGFLTIGNPIELVGRSPVEAYATSVGLEEDDVQMRLAQIDVKTRQGLRDMALLLVLFMTGRRASEVASLRWRHLQISKKGQVTLSFEHCKGGKSTRDMLDETAGGVLIAWLQKAYGRRFPGHMDNNDPIWLNLANPTHEGEPLGYQGIAGICKRYLGTSKVHVTRHTCALFLEEAGAKLTDIQGQLLHSNAATTGIYLTRVKRRTNQFAGKLVAMLGVSDILDEIEGGSERNKMPPQRQAHALPEGLRERSRQG